MENKKYIGTFYSINTVLYKITELKAQGYDESDMYAVQMKKTIFRCSGDRLTPNSSVHQMKIG